MSIRADDVRQKLQQRLSNVQREKLSGGGFLQAAVLVPLIRTGKGVDLLFTKRTDSVETHKGQISFPGGVVDQEDRDPVHTALREAQEEIGLNAGEVETLGLLDDLATPTGFIITPVVGFLQQWPVLVVNEAEVAEVFSVPLEFFAGERHAERELRIVHGKAHQVWVYKRDDHVIWGATAVIIRSLLRRLESV